MSPKKTIYLDNNGTTQPPPIVCEAAKKYATAANPSSDTYLSEKSKQVMKDCKDFICKQLHIPKENMNSKSGKKKNKNTYKVLFTSGASESNSMIIRSCVDAYNKNIGLPHIITSTTEHKCILETVHNLLTNGRIQLTLIKPGMDGLIDPEKVRKAIKPNTALISIMLVNNEIGCINDIETIGKIAHDAKVPLHTDMTQGFMKLKTNIPQMNVDAVSVSFHKVYGVKGSGALIISKNLIDGYGLQSQIGGNQNEGLRGGTENVLGIATALAGMKWMSTNRAEKNERICKMREIIKDHLSKIGRIASMEEYYDPKHEKSSTHNPIEVMIIGPKNKKQQAHHTMLISILKNKGRPFCNVKLKKFLESKGVIVSIGSACNTSSKNASHVIQTIGTPAVVRKGVLRISFGDRNTFAEINQAMKILREGVENQLEKNINWT